jgi:hypothetical protein
MFWVGYFTLQTTVVCQDKQSFAVAIQTACGINLGDVNEFGQGFAGAALGALVGELRQNVKGFVEQYGACHGVVFARPADLGNVQYAKNPPNKRRAFGV